MQNDKKEHCSGTLVGAALGDAIGEIAFGFSEREKLEETVRGKERLCYTDDTAMMIGLAESMIERGMIETEYTGTIFHRNFNREPWRGYAGSPPTVFSRVEREGVTYAEAASALYDGKGSFGNGAAMRVTPVGLVYWDNDNLYEMVEHSARSTHAHPVGIDGAAVLAKLIARVCAPVAGELVDRMSILDELAEFSRTEEMKRQVSRVKEAISKKMPLHMAGLNLGFGVEAHHSVPMALYSFLVHPDSFKDVLFCTALNSFRSGHRSMYGLRCFRGVPGNRRDTPGVDEEAGKP